MSKKILYHGSPEIVTKPEFGLGKPYNDYGSGFYCTEHLELAKEWSVTEGVDGYSNKYEIDTSGLSILDLSSSDYTILHWLAILVDYRRFQITTTVMRRGVEYLKENFSVDISSYDVITGYRADDSYFKFAKAFLTNQISLAQLSYAMRLGSLGEQFVLKSPTAFEKIEFLSYETCDSSIYYPKRKARNDAARDAFNAELEKDDLDGIFMRDVIRNEVKKDDPCLR